MIELENNTKSCCSDGYSCCKPERKKIVIDFLYLDLTICERCKGTENNLDAAIKEVSEILKAAGYDVVVKKININSEELAYKYHFISSPTIRINGRDISPELKESYCCDCGEICGDEVDCRVWMLDGEEYAVPPKSFIVDAILKEVYGGGYRQNDAEKILNEEYTLPENLKKFFKGLKI